MKLLGQTGRYFLVALVGLAVDFGLLVGLTELASVPYLVGAVCGFVGGLAVNFFLSEWFVFGDPVISSRWVRLGIYAVIGLVGLGILTGLMWLQVELLAWNYIVAKVAATAIVYVWNFLARRAMYKP